MSNMTFPEIPDVPNEQQSEALFVLRYEDIAQDGMIKLAALPNAFSDAIWRNLMSKHPMQRRAFKQGILPILSRFVLSHEKVSVSPQWPLRIKARYQIAQSINPRGETERILANFWAALFGKPGHPLSPTPTGDEEVLIGRAFGEHIFTRPFAPKEERKVTSLAGLSDDPLPPLPVQEWSPSHALLQQADGALSPSETVITFGLIHTDGNQHVNSLVYPRLFEEAAVRAFASQGQEITTAATQLDIRFRKPCFAGERLRVWLRLSQSNGSPIAFGSLHPESDTSPQPEQGRCFISIRF
jgi:hypothetical protein